MAPVQSRWSRRWSAWRWLVSMPDSRCGGQTLEPRVGLSSSRPGFLSGGLSRADPCGVSFVVLGPHGRQFKRVFDQTQKELRDKFGMEMVELPMREKITISQRRGATSLCRAGNETLTGMTRYSCAKNRQILNNVQSVRLDLDSAGAVPNHRRYHRAASSAHLPERSNVRGAVHLHRLGHLSVWRKHRRGKAGTILETDQRRALYAHRQDGQTAAEALQRRLPGQGQGLERRRGGCGLHGRAKRKSGDWARWSGRPGEVRLWRRRRRGP